MARCIRTRLTLRMWQDGYRMALPEPLMDSPVPADSAGVAELRRLCAEVTRLAEQWVDRVR